MYSRRPNYKNAKIMPRRYESHTGSFWQVAKAIAQTLIKKGSHFEVYYPTLSTLQKVAEAESENDMDNAFAQAMKGHYRFVFSRNDVNDNMKLYPTVIVLSDDMYSSDKDMAAFMAGHVYVQEELLLGIVERFFEDDSEATLADIFDAVDVRRERHPQKTNRKGNSYVDQDDSGVDVHGFALADNGTVRELCMDAMVAALDDDLNADFDDVCTKLTVQNPGIVPFNAGMTDNAMSDKLPKYRMENGSVIQVSNKMDFKEIKALVSKYMMEWCEPRNHSGKMWNRAWEFVLENILLDHWDDNVDVLDFNPYYVERRNGRNGYIHLTKEMLSRIRPNVRRNKKESRRFNGTICNESLNSLIHGFEIRHVSALKETLYMLVDNDICDGYSKACSCDDRNNLSDLVMFVKADLCAFPVWCAVTDHGEDVTFGVYDIKKSAREISDSLIRSVIRDGRIDKTFSYNDVRAIAKEIIHDILEDEKSYENIPSETRLWMTMELPCTEAEIYMLLNRADHYFASVKKEMENDLTNGVCFALGISPFEDEFGIAGYRRN